MFQVWVARISMAAYSRANHIINCEFQSRGWSWHASSFAEQDPPCKDLVPVVEPSHRTINDLFYNN
jgi:hypothetical protein